MQVATEVQARRKLGGPGGAYVPPHFLADQLTLYQPGGHIISTQYYVPPQIFRPCDGPGEATLEKATKRNKLFAQQLTFWGPKIL